MFNRANLLIVAVAVVGATLGLLAGRHFDKPAERPLPPGVTVLKLGDVRPDLTFADLDNREHRLSEWNGRVVLLNFWAAWCNPCRDEMPLLEAVHRDDGVQVIGIAVDDPEDVRDYLKDNPVSFPILIADDKHDPSIQFGNTRQAYPYSVLIGPDGRLIAQKLGGFERADLKDWLSSNLASAD